MHLEIVRCRQCVGGGTVYALLSCHTMHEGTEGTVWHLLIRYPYGDCVLPSGVHILSYDVYITVLRRTVRYFYNLAFFKHFVEFYCSIFVDDGTVLA